jgi:hypothetical protein
VTVLGLWLVKLPFEAGITRHQTDINSHLLNAHYQFFKFVGITKISPLILSCTVSLNYYFHVATGVLLPIQRMRIVPNLCQLIPARQHGTLISTRQPFTFHVKVPFHRTSHPWPPRNDTNMSKYEIVFFAELHPL